MSTWAKTAPPSRLQVFPNEPASCSTAPEISGSTETSVLHGISPRSAEGKLWGAAEGYKGEEAPEGADVYTVNSNGGPGGANDPSPP